MERFILLAAALLASCTVALAQESKAKTPAGLPPLFAVVQSVDKPNGAVELGVIQPKTVFDKKVAPAAAGEKGQEYFTPRTTTQFVGETCPLTAFGHKSGWQCYTLAGKPINSDVLSKRLAPGQIVLLAQDGQKLDPLYAAVLNNDAIVLVKEIPAEPAGNGPPVIISQPTPGGR